MVRNVPLSRYWKLFDFVQTLLNGAFSEERFAPSLVVSAPHVVTIVPTSPHHTHKI